MEFWPFGNRVTHEALKSGASGMELMTSTITFTVWEAGTGQKLSAIRSKNG
jgi:hypothetical protein